MSLSTMGMASAVRGAAAANQGALGFQSARMMSDRPKSETGRVSKMTNITKSDGAVPELTSMKRGQGFRSSFSGKVATIFGCSGSLGRYVTSRVGRSGTQCIMPYRCDHYDVLRLKLCGDLGQVLFTEFHLQDEESVMKAVKHSDIVINMIGREYETKNFTFNDVHNEGARMLARCAKQAGARTFIHVSHLLASENPETLWNSPKSASGYLKSKFLGDMAVMEEFPDATIIRPSEMIGTQDWFTWYYRGIMRRGNKWAVPLWKKGHYTVKAPVSYTNVTDAIQIAMDDPNCKGKIYEAAGPERHTLHDLVEFMGTIMDLTERSDGFCIQDLRMAPLPWIKAGLVQYAPFGQKTFVGSTLEKLERSQLSDISQGYPSIAEMGVKLQTAKESLPWAIEPWRQNRYLHGPIDTTTVPLRVLTRVEEEEIHAEGKQSPFNILGL